MREFEEHYSLEDFERGALAPSGTFSFEGSFLSNFSVIKAIGNGELLVSNGRLPDACLFKVNVESGECISAVPLGRARGEVLTPWDLDSRHGRLWVSSPTEGKILELDEGLGLVDEHVMRSKFSRALPYRDSLFLALSDFTSGNRLETYSLDGTVRDTLGSFPVLRGSPDVEMNNAFMQASLCISPDARHVAVACLSYEYLDIYGEDMGLRVRPTGPKDVPQRAKLTQHGDITTFDQPDASHVYRTVTADDEGFMVGYVGVSVREPGYDDAHIGRLLSFDWEGDPRKSYDLDVPVISFDVDWPTGTLYCLVDGEEPYIARYKL